MTITTKPPARHHIDRRAADLAAALIEADGDVLVDTVELARRLRISVQFLEIGRHRGFGPPFIKLSPRRIRYKWSSVIAWLNDRAHASTAEYRSIQ